MVAVAVAVTSVLLLPSADCLAAPRFSATEHWAFPDPRQFLRFTILRARRSRSSRRAAASTAALLLGHLAYRCRGVKWRPMRDSLIRRIISLMVRFNSLLGPNKFPVPMRRELPH